MNSRNIYQQTKHLKLHIKHLNKENCFMYAYVLYTFEKKMFYYINTGTIISQIQNTTEFKQIDSFVSFL